MRTFNFLLLTLTPNSKDSGAPVGLDWMDFSIPVKKFKAILPLFIPLDQTLLNLKNKAAVKWVGKGQKQRRKGKEVQLMSIKTKEAKTVQLSHKHGNMIS